MATAILEGASAPHFAPSEAKVKQILARNLGLFAKNDENGEVPGSRPAKSTKNGVYVLWITHLRAITRLFFSFQRDLARFFCLNPVGLSRALVGWPQGLPKQVDAH